MAHREGKDAEPQAAAKTSFLRPDSAAWTDALPRTDHVRLFLEADWPSTPLGALANFDSALRFYVTMLFSDTRAACVYWGPERVAIYNEVFAPSAGEAHPRLMGKPFTQGFQDPDLWNACKPIFDQVESTAQPVDVVNIPLFVDRNNDGHIEETYFIGQFIPLRGDSGLVEGFYNTSYESTQHVLHDRRREVIERISSLPPTPMDKTLAGTLEIMHSNPRDIPMAVMYVMEDLGLVDNSRLRLGGTIGMPENHRCLPKIAELHTSDIPLVKLLRQAQQAEKTLWLDYDDSRFHDEIGHMFEDVTWAGFGERPRTIAVIPLSSGGRLLGFIVRGTNPRGARQDDRERKSIVDMARQIESKWSASISVMEAKKREEHLERQLTDSESRLQEMARKAPLGMCQITPDGRFQWANDQFFDIAGFRRGPTLPTVAEFLEVYLPEDRPAAAKELSKLLDGTSTTSTSELRLNRTWKPSGEEGEAEINVWQLATGFPLVEDGEIKCIQGFFTDITHQKWAETVQSRNAAAAVDAKRRQEEFIDVVSHEMRNPLTAMTQLADGIASSMDGFDKSTVSAAALSVMHSNVEAASTILSCAQHQRRIIDDVLILSRLESQMLSITPVPQQPNVIMNGCVSMFGGELRESDTALRLIKDQSYDQCHVDHVLCDPSRLMQVMINLISNAIKFTSKQNRRAIAVTYGASLERPELQTEFGRMTWLTRKDNTTPPSPLGMDSLYLYFLVQDTGPGLTPAEIERLFKRFSQASSKTHVKYGGSGLGLYICRELAEKQGGQVGVASHAGRGAVFGFYIATTRINNYRGNSGSTAGLPQTTATTNGVDRQHKRSLTGSQSEPIARTASVSLSNAVRQEFHVLLVEDNLVNQRVLARQLKMAKCTVHVANHGAEALELLPKFDCWQNPEHNGTRASKGDQKRELLPLDVILLDWEMPVLNGLDCCKRIRELERDGHINRRLLVIAITANVRQEQIDQAMAAGMDDVMPKPFTVKDLIQRITEKIGAG